MYPLLINRLLNFGEGKSVYTFSNADNKTWLIPARNMQVAMNLYQPSGVKGKLLKRFFPYLHNIGLVRSVIKAERTVGELQKDLHNLLSDIFNTPDLEFAVFCGTPCVHQKITIQLSKRNRILGYCKVTDNEEIAQMFHGEAEVLRRLERQRMKGIPQCLYCGEINEGIHLFVQSTTKTQQSKVPHEWGALHEAFLEELHRQTQQKVLFEESDYYQTLQDLQLHLNWLPQFIDRKLIEKAIDKIKVSNHGKHVEFSAYHADFTPWNMFVENGRLFVFDWEYARLIYPPQLDRYHFFTQTAIFEKQWDISQIIGYINSEAGKWIDPEKYSLYLIDVISRYTLREKGSVTGNMTNFFSLWTYLLDYFENSNKFNSI